MDHLIFGVPDLDEGVGHVEALLGVEAAPGGRHLGLGTHNRLVGLGPTAYLEIIAPDPDQPSPTRPMWFGLDALAEPRLLSWCAASPDLAVAVGRGRAVGIDLGGAIEGSRLREDGTPLSWTMTDPWAERGGGVVPFLIDWGTTEHPGARLPALCRCVGLRIGHPDPDAAGRWLTALGVPGVPDGDTPSVTVDLVQAEAPRLTAVLEGPRGLVELS